MDDPEFLKNIRALSCLACGSSESVEAHHIRSRGAGGKDEAFNIIPLCIRDHRVGNKSWHKKGFSQFFLQYPHVWEHLKKLKWYINQFGRLKHPDYDKGIYE